jgi:hypothetical protein
MNDRESHFKSRNGAWKWISGLFIVFFTLALWLWVGRKPTPSPPTKVILTEKPAIVAWPQGPAIAAVEAARTRANTNEIEVCGVGKVKIDSDDPTAIGKYLEALAKKSELRWLSALRNSDDLRARTTGLLLEGVFTDRGADQVVTQEARDELVQLAVGASDPAVYALAIYKCGANEIDPAAGACLQVSPRGWARLDPDNAIPWLWVAGQARAKNDMAAEADAFQRAAEARRSDSYIDSIFSFAEPEIPKDATPVERAELAVEVIGVEAATAQRQFAAATKHCSSDALQDRNIRQQCSALAELFVNNGKTLADFVIGLGIGNRAGWPKDRVSALTEEKNALMQASAQVTPENGEAWSCDGVSRLNAFVNQVGRLGELGATRDALERSGETIAEMAAKWTAFLERIQREAAQQTPQSAVDSSP